MQELYTNSLERNVRERDSLLEMIRQFLSLIVFRGPHKATILGDLVHLTVPFLFRTA